MRVCENELNGLGLGGEAQRGRFITTAVESLEAPGPLAVAQNTDEPTADARGGPELEGSLSTES